MERYVENQNFLFVCIITNKISEKVFVAIGYAQFKLFTYLRGSDIQKFYLRSGDGGEAHLHLFRLKIGRKIRNSVQSLEVAFLLYSLDQTLPYLKTGDL